MNIIFCYYAVNTFSFHMLISNKPTHSTSQLHPEKRIYFYVHLTLWSELQSPSILGKQCYFVHSNYKGTCLIYFWTLLFMYQMKQKFIIFCKKKKTLVGHTLESTPSATTWNHCHLPQSLSPRVLTPSGFVSRALCGSQSTRPLINRLELLTGGSSIPHRPCHFHYCISIMHHFRDKARRRRWAGQKPPPH